MASSKPLTIGLSIVVLVLGLSVGAITVSSTAADIQITSVSVTPEEPMPGEDVTVETTVSSLSESASPVEVTDLYIREQDSATEKARAEDIGSISPGGSLSIPLSLSFEDSGSERLTVFVRVEDESGSGTTYKYPLHITVENPDEALLEVVTSDSAAEGTTPVNVTVTNANTESISGVQLSLSASRGSVDQMERIEGSIEAGSSETYRYDVNFEETGTHSIDAKVTYTTAEGSTRTITETRSVFVESPVVDAYLSTRSDANQSSQTRLQLSNFGNTVLENVEVRAISDSTVIDRAMMKDVNPDTSGFTTLDLGTAGDSTIRYEATYSSAGEEYTTSVEDSAGMTGEIRLTRLDVTQTVGEITIEGEAANLGGSDAESVLLTIQNGQGVSSATPGGYFIGEVQSSEFNTFEISATVANETSVIPIQMTYLVNGNRVKDTQTIQLSNFDLAGGPAGAPTGGLPENMESGPSGPTPPSSGGLLSSLPLPLLLVGLLILLGGVGYGTYRWRNP